MSNWRTDSEFLDENIGTTFKRTSTDENNFIYPRSEKTFFFKNSNAEFPENLSRTPRVSVVYAD